MSHTMTPKLESRHSTVSSLALALPAQTASGHNLPNKTDTLAVPRRSGQKLGKKSSRTSARSNRSRRDSTKKSVSVRTHSGQSQIKLSLHSLLAASIAKHRRPLSLEHRSHLLLIDRKIRVNIWNLLSFADRHSLRLTCKVLRNDIDEGVGLKANLDEYDVDFPNHARLGLQDVTIINLNSFHGEILRHPLLLTDLRLAGSIRSHSFANLMQQCENIRTLTIQFTRDIFMNRPKLFPVELKDRPPKRILLKLQFFQFHAAAKSESELKYIADNFTGLIDQHLRHYVNVTQMHIQIISRFSHQYLDDCSISLSALVCECHDSLTDLHVEMKSQYSKSSLAEMADKSRGSTVFEATPLIQHQTMDQLLFEDICVEKTEPRWRTFTKLQTLSFSTNANEFACSWEEFGRFVQGLETIALDIPSPRSWTIYRQFIEGSENTLAAISLENVENYTTEKASTDIDLSVFHPFQKLESLVLLKSNHPTMTTSRMKRVSRLPRSLRYLEFAWLYLTPCQTMRLFRLPMLNSLRLAYWSLSNKDFGQLLFYVRLAYCCGCIEKDKEFIITDLKIRFQFNKKQLDAILNNSLISAEYIDFNNTQLILTKK